MSAGEVRDVDRAVGQGELNGSGSREAERFSKTQFDMVFFPAHGLDDDVVGGFKE